MGFCAEKCSECGTLRAMRTLTQLQQNRRVVQDFTQTTLAGIPGLFARLAYIASLHTRAFPRFIQTRPSSRLCSFVMNRSSSGYWNRRSPARKRTCGPAWQAWKAGCLPRFVTGAATKPTGFCSPKQRRIISRTFSARISALFWRFSIRTALRPIQARNYTCDPPHDFRLVRNPPHLRHAMR